MPTHRRSLRPERDCGPDIPACFGLGPLDLDWGVGPLGPGEALAVGAGLGNAGLLERLRAQGAPGFGEAPDGGDAGLGGWRLDSPGEGVAPASPPVGAPEEAADNPAQAPGAGLQEARGLLDAAPEALDAARVDPSARAPASPPVGAPEEAADNPAQAPGAGLQEAGGLLDAAPEALDAAWGALRDQAPAALGARRDALAEATPEVPADAGCVVGEAPLHPTIEGASGAVAPSGEGLAAMDAQALEQLDAAAAWSALESRVDFGERTLGAPSSAERLYTPALSSLPPVVLPDGEGHLPPALHGHLDALEPALQRALQSGLSEARGAEQLLSGDGALAIATTTQEIDRASTRATEEQLALRDAAIGDVDGARGEWRAELARVSEHARGEAQLAHTEHDLRIQATTQAARDEASAHLDGARAQVEALQGEAEQEAGLLGGLTDLVEALYTRLRAAVAAVLDAAKRLAEAAIEAGWRAAQALVQGYARVLQGIVQVALAAFPEASARWCARIDAALQHAQAAMATLARAHKALVIGLLDALASTLDAVLELALDAWVGGLGLVGMVVSGDWAEIQAGLTNLLEAAKMAPPQFEVAAWEELLGGDLDQPLSPEELAAAGLGTAQEALPGPPWTDQNVGADPVLSALALSPGLVEQLQDAGEVEFGASADPDRRIERILGLDEQGARDDGLSPEQRAQARWGLMKAGLRQWWAANWPLVLAGGVVGLAGFVGLNLLTGGAVTAALPAVLAAVGGVMGGAGALQLAGHVRDFLEKGWAGDVQGGGKSLAKGLAAGAIELVSLVTMKAGSAAKAGARALGRGARAAGRASAGVARRGVDFVVERGRVLLRGLDDAAVGRDARSLDELGDALLARTRFRGFKISLKGARLRLWGRVNPWVKLVDGKVTQTEEGTSEAKWLSEPEYRALKDQHIGVLPRREVKPGERPDVRGTFTTDEAVPAHYREDPERFRALASDPDHAGKISSASRQEAMAGLQAERDGLLPRPIVRGPKGIEFIDGEGRPWDVKAPPSPRPDERWAFRVEQAADSIAHELRKPAMENPFVFGKEPRRVLLDSSMLTRDDHLALWERLSTTLTPEELGRVVEVNCRF